MAPSQRPEPAGFGNCVRCAYRDVGPAALCYVCASRRLQRPAASTHCTVCDQQLPASGHCANSLCHSPDRQFAWNQSIAMKTGPLEAAILSWKDDGKWGHGLIFARVVLGYLQEEPGFTQQFDAIAPMPACTRPGAPAHADHAGFVVAKAAEDDDSGIPFAVEPRLIVKTHPTRKMRNCASLPERRALAATQLRASLKVPDPGLVIGRRILVYDDVFTEGSTLNEVARALRAAGATEVAGLTLARQTWRSAA